MPGSVLISDDDATISGLVAEILSEEGFTVAELLNTRPAAIWEKVASLKPDLVLLDGCGALGYGESWEVAARLRHRKPPIAVIMFTGHAQELTEARLGKSGRSERAAFAGVLSKPFDLQLLIDTVAALSTSPA
jgi:DNA-binding response OmpR family regulator